MPEATAFPSQGTLGSDELVFLTVSYITWPPERRQKHRQAAGLGITALLLCVSFCKLLNLSVHQFSHLSSGAEDGNNYYFMRVKLGNTQKVGCLSSACEGKHYLSTTIMTVSLSPLFPPMHRPQPFRRGKNKLLALCL